MLKELLGTTFHKVVSFVMGSLAKTIVKAKEKRTIYVNFALESFGRRSHIVIYVR